MRSNPEIARQQSVYMQHRFSFFGIQSPLRKSIQSPFLLKKNLPEKQEGFKVVAELWEAPQRELHYVAMELLFRYKKHYENRDITFFESLITEHSWWDSIDFIAPKIVGAHFLMFPEERGGKVDRWIKSGNIWLQRSAVLFQLKYKDKLDRELLSHIIHQLKDEKEFFIRKAIGWMLREYSKVDADWVQQFLRNTRLQPLSEREALKWIQRTNEEG